MGFAICCNTAREQTISNIQLTITYTTESAYSVTFTEANGVKSTVKIGNLDATAGAKLTDGTYSFIATATGYYDYNGSFTVAGADINVPFALSPKGIYNYSVRAFDKDNNDLGVVGTGSDYENSNITYHYPRFALSGETLYVKNKKSDNPWFGISDMLSSDGQEFNVTYSDGIIENVVFYKEAEDIEGMLSTTTSNADIRCSNGTGAYTPDGEDITVTELQPGIYQIFTSVWGNAGTTFNIICGDVTLTCETKGYIQDYNSEEIVLTAATPVVIQAAGNANRCLDFIYIVRVPESYDYIVKAVDSDYNELSVIAQGSAYAGSTVTVPYPRFVADGTSLKEAAANNKEYNLTFTLDANPTEQFISYDQSTIENVEFYAEAEKIEGMTAVTGGNANVRCSMAAGAYAADADVYVTTLQPGNYIISTAVWGNAGSTLNIVCGDVTLACETTGSLTVRNSESFTLTAATDVYIQQGGQGGNSPKCFDYIYIQQVPDSYNYSLEAVDPDGATLESSTGKVYAGLDVTVPYHRFIYANNSLFEADATNKEYRRTFTVDEDNKKEVVDYSNKSISNIVYIAEAEDIVGMTKADRAQAESRCSMAAGAFAEADVTITTLPAGVYTITAAFCGNEGTTLQIACGDETLDCATNGSYTTLSKTFTLTSTADIIIKAGGSGGSSPKCFDLIYIQELPANVTATIGAEGWATLYTDYAISFEGTGIAAYTATTDGTSVTLTEVQDVPAGTGVVLKGTAGDYQFNVIGGSANEKGDLKGSATNDLDFATADAAYNYYMLVKNASGNAQFKLLNSGVIAAGKAYLQVVNSGARDLNIVFNEATGINAIMAAEAAKGAYNLAGQRVAAPQKGLYIVNGKKVVVK